MAREKGPPDLLEQSKLQEVEKTTMAIEKVVFESMSGKIRGILSGNLDTPRLAFLCLHGGPGGDLNGNTNIFNDLARLAASLECCTLQYSVFGADPSDGLPADISISSQLDDMYAAIRFLRTKVACPIDLVGESAGATIVSQSWPEDISGYVMLWPAFDLADTDLKPYLSGKWKDVADQNGFVNDNGVILGKMLINEINDRDFSKSFELPDKPVFIAHGQKDNEVPYYQSLRAIPTAKGPLTFVSHPEAMHGFKTPAQRKFLLSQLKSWIISRFDN